MAHNTIYSNPNGFPLANGYTLHMDLTNGDLANRIVTVGSVPRAEMIAGFLDATPEVRRFSSSRGFVSFTGCFNGVPVSIVAIGMGVAMMDFFVREAKAVVEGPMAIVRFGTCGGISTDAAQGKIAVASKGSGYVTRNPNAFADLYFNPSSSSSSSPETHIAPYDYHTIAPADEEFSALVVKLLSESIGVDTVVQGVNVTADSFYSSQGRIDERFHDSNPNLFQHVHDKYAEAQSMEMETFQLFHLAKCCTTSIKATAAAVIVANRITNHVIEDEMLMKLEKLGGKAVLQAVSLVSLY